MSAPEDQAFARFARTGDPAALGEVYDRVAAELLNVAVRLTRDPVEAEDVLQATFVTAIERAEAFAPGRRVLPWLAGILANQARAARRRPRASGEAADGEAGASASPEAEAARRELCEQLDASLERVPEAFRPVLILRVRHGLSAAEIAHALQRPPGTVRSQLARGLELLRRSLPAGLAGATALFFAAPARGLPGVREAVLAHAQLVGVGATGAGLTLSTLAGALLVKKSLAVALAAVVAATVWWSWPSTQPAPARAAAPEAARPELAALEDPAPRAAATPERSAVAHAVEPAPVQATRPERQPPVATGRLEVRARHADGRPAAGALAVVALDGADWQRRPELRAATDADGRATFADVPPGHHRARLLLGSGAFVWVRAGETKQVELLAHDGYAVTVEVLGPLDRPVPDAEVWLSERSEPGRGHVVGRTDGQGRLVLADVDDYHYVGARAPGFAMSAVQNVRGLAGGAYTVRVRLAADGTSVRGRVIGPGGEPVARAVVLIGPDQDPSALRLESGLVMPGPPPARASTDAAGAFRAEGVALGAQPVRVQAEGYAAFEGLYPLGGADPITVQLAPEARVVGRVLDAAGEPVAGARIATTGRAGAAGSTTHSDATGAYDLRGLAGGAIALQATHPERGRAALELVVREGTTSRWDATLESVPRIFGRLLDVEGRPLASWPVTAMDDEVGRAGAHTITTDDEGRFSIGGLVDRVYTLWVNEPGSWRGFPRHVEPGVRPSTSEVVLRLEDTAWERGALAGEVLGPDGAPATDALITLWHVEQRMWRSFPVDPASGRIEVAAVYPGTLQVQVRSPSHPWVALGEHAVAAGEVTDLGTVRLSAGGRVQGTLSGGSEEGLESLEFLIGAAAGGEGGTVVRDGREFHTSPLREGDYTLIVRGDRIASQEVPFRVEAGATLRLDLVLEPALLREVVLELAPDAAPSRSAWATVHDVAGRRVWTDFSLWADEQGRFHARVSVPAGSYTLFARAGEAEASVPLVVDLDPVPQAALLVVLR